MTDIDLDNIPIEQRPAKTLTDVARTVTLQPLEPDDRRYVDLSPGVGTDDLELLRQKLRDAASGAALDESGSNFLKVLISSHRGCGKTTELRRIELEVSDQFTSLHLGLDESLRDEFDYTLLCVWLTEELTLQFDKVGMPLPAAEVALIDQWFEEKIVTDKTTRQSSIAVEAEAEGKAGGGLLGMGLNFLSRFKASLRGDRARQVETKSVLRHFSRELIDRMNQLFAAAAQTLRAHDKADRLLIVQDNLDRLSRETAIEFFLTNGEILRDLRAHMIFTPPNAITLANKKIQNNFDESYILPMVKLRSADDQPYGPGAAVLREVVAKRVDIETLFETPASVDRLIALSGGSVRDLVRLLSRAALRARAKKRTQIDAADVENALSMMRDEFETGLLPSQRYFSWLADIHLRRQDCLGDDEWRTDQRFADLVLMGAVFAYKNSKNWYDVHPAILESWLFEDAVKKAAAKTDV